MLICWGCSPPYIFLHVFVCRHRLFNLTRDLSGLVQAWPACFTLPTQTSVRNAGNTKANKYSQEEKRVDLGITIFRTPRGEWPRSGETMNLHLSKARERPMQESVSIT